ncbi:MAG: hypothetical protein AAGH49_10555 [Pseudomonadota bacterium]
MKGVPKIIFDPADFAADAGAAAWSRMFQFLHRARPLDVPGRPFASFVNSYIMDGLILGQGFFGLQTMTFDETKDQVLGGEKYLVAWVLGRGRMNILHDGEMLDVGPGEYCLIDQSRTSYALLTDCDVLSMIIPHSAIGYDPTQHPARVHVELTAPGAALLHEDLKELARIAPQMSRRDAPSYSARHRELVLSLLNTRATPSAGPASLGVQVRAFVDGRMFDAALTLETIMEQFALSRAAIMQHLGLPISLQAYQKSRRLIYAMRSLAFGPADRNRIRVVSDRLGYDTQTAFESDFEAALRFPPEVVLGVLSDAGVPPKITADAQLWKTWLNGTH